MRKLPTLEPGTEGETVAGKKRDQMKSGSGVLIIKTYCAQSPPHAYAFMVRSNAQKVQTTTCLLNRSCRTHRVWDESGERWTRAFQLLFLEFQRWLRHLPVVTTSSRRPGVLKSILHTNALLMPAAHLITWKSNVLRVLASDNMQNQSWYFQDGIEIKQPCRV